MDHHVTYLKNDDSMSSSNIPFDNTVFYSLRWEHPIKKRYYKIYLSRDLLGDLVVTRVWGGINNANGKISHYCCSSHEDAQKIIKKIAHTRSRHGYVIIS